jgi:hypothetical protein
VDPELAKALALIVPGLPSLIGTLIGATIGAAITYVTARQTRRNALDLDRQRALREDLLSLLGPLRAQVSERTEEVVGARDAAFYAATFVPDDEDDEESIREASKAVDQLKWRPDVDTGAWAAAGDAAILALYRAWRDLDRRCYANVRTLAREGPHGANYGRPTDDMFDEYSAAAVKLTTAINDLLHGAAIRRPPQHPAGRWRLPWRRERRTALDTSQQAGSK